MTRAMVKMLRYDPPWKNRIDSSWNYSYYYLWKRIFAGMRDKKKLPLVGYNPNCPVAFLWGTKKPVQFYGKSWADRIAKDPRNEVHAVESVHWIMLDQPKFLIDLIRRRIRLFK